ncbi:MAG TPA: hypothetical protein VJ046_01605 [Candidatus Paceibacterota bacterium]|nr:hypothetical protein [Candidatus Paceibacterota bacterium]
MRRSVSPRLLMLAFLSVMLTIRVAVCNAQVIDPSTPKDPFTAAILEGIRTGKPPSRIDGCAVSEEAAKVHAGENGEENYEEASIRYVNDDNTVQVQTVDILNWKYAESAPN